MGAAPQANQAWRNTMRDATIKPSEKRALPANRRPNGRVHCRGLAALPRLVPLPPGRSTTK
eukprot:3924464-Pyramimonas_sp.AAC.1